MTRMDMMTASCAVGLIAMAGAALFAYRWAPRAGHIFARRAHSRAIGEEMRISVSSQGKAIGRRAALFAIILVAVGFVRGGIVVGLMCVPWSFVAASLYAADVGYGYLPHELNALLLLAGVAVQGVLDTHALLFGCFAGSAFALASSSLRLLGRCTGRDLIGGGDVKAIVGISVGSGFGCIAGSLACCVAVLVVEGTRSVILKVRSAHTQDSARCCIGTEKRTFPLAPYLMVWLLVGFALG